jgi:hypothetical protein
MFSVIFFSKVSIITRNFLLVVTFACILPVCVAVAGTHPKLPAPPGMEATTDWNQVEYVIITTADLQTEFNRLADWRSEQGLGAAVVTVDWILDVAPEGRDVQETIRNFLILAHDQWQTHYVLLGGSWGILPPRYVRTQINPYPDTDYTDFISDWYFGCLDGTWDADEDGVFGEFSSEGDDPDLEPELAIGRAPVRTAAEAEIFVNKVMEHETAAGSSYLDSALFIAQVLTPHDWQPGDPVYLDGAQVLDDLLPFFDSTQPPIQVTRLYENFEDYPLAAPLSRQATIESLSSGDFNFVYHWGFGNSSALSLGGYPIEQTLSIADVPLLTNSPNYFTIMSLIGPTAFNPDFPTLFETMICSETGGAVAAFAKTEVAYISTSRMIEEAFIQNLLSSDHVPLGQALMHTLADFSDSASETTIIHFGILEFVLLGDPAMLFRPGTAVSGLETIPSHPSNVSIDSCTPNPFNPSTTIQFEVLGSRGTEHPTTLAIYDASGRQVATLMDESLVVGQYERTWNGVDNTGQCVGSGIYLVVVTVDGQNAVKKIMLLK